jgi:glycine/betaine/sarcosine/D-proline reductase family selenoprotein B
LEKAGIPTVQITAALPIAKMVGANRTVLGKAIVHVVGDPSQSAENEKKARRQLIEQALESLEQKAETASPQA